MISGGATGIGRSVATMFAREGANVSIIYLPNQQSEAEDVRKSVQEAGKSCCLIPGDLRAPRFCEDAVAIHIKTFGGINVSHRAVKHIGSLTLYALDFGQQRALATASDL